jgi:hypothetical protein
VSLVIVAVAMVSVVTSWSDDPVDDAGSSLATSPVVSAGDGGSGSSDGVSPGSDTGATSPSTAAPSSSIAPSTTRYSGPPRAATLAFTGDIIPDSQVGKLARHYAQGSADVYDFVPMFERVAAELTAADLAICHLETTVQIGGRVSGGPDYLAPVELAAAVAESGWDGCSMASEHAYGYGAEGVSATVDALDSVGLRWAGIAVDPDDSGRAVLYDAAGITVAHLAYTGVADGKSPPAEEPWWVAPADADRILTDAAGARAAGAEFVVVSIHWGTEYEQAPDSGQRELAEALAAGGVVDLVIGHHAHVVQPLDRVGDMWVAYGLGNFLSNQTPGCCGVESEDGVVLHVRIGDTDDGVVVTGLSYTPTWVDRVRMQVMVVSSRLTEPGLEAWYRAVLRNSWNRTGDALTALGADELGLEPVGSLP